MERKMINGAPSSSGGSGQQQSSQAPNYSRIRPPTTTTTQTTTPNWEILFRQLNPDLPENFSDILKRVFFGDTGTNDFPDDKLRGKKAIRLIPLEDNEVCRLGKELFERINYSVSQYHIGVIFILAFQLKNPGEGRTERMFPAFDELGIPEDIDYFSLDRSGMLDGGYTTTIHESGEIYENAMAYSFLACSILKYFVPSADNFSNSLEKIQSGFRKFYARDFPLGAIDMQRNTISHIYCQFTKVLMRNTLYRFLYNANHRGKVNEVQSFLYDMYLEYNCMHVIPIAFKLCEAFQCSSAQLISAIYSEMFEPQIEGLKSAFLLLGRKEGSYRRQMWKYAELFDFTFLKPLQTRRCVRFVFILACMLKIESPAANSGIMEIKQFEEISESDRVRLENGTRLHMTELKNSLASKQYFNLVTRLI